VDIKVQGLGENLPQIYQSEQEKICTNLIN